MTGLRTGTLGKALDLDRGQAGRSSVIARLSNNLPLSKGLTGHLDQSSASFRDLGTDTRHHESLIDHHATKLIARPVTADALQHIVLSWSHDGVGLVQRPFPIST
jgi:hypothetical protein